MITLTEKAARHIKSLFDKKELPDTSCVRFAIKGGGCSGFSYTASIEPPRKFEMAGRHDAKQVSNDIRILVDAKSMLFLDGSEIDFEVSNFGHSFIYKNPNAKGVCGCGESFSV